MIHKTETHTRINKCIIRRKMTTTKKKINRLKPTSSRESCWSHTRFTYSLPYQQVRYGKRITNNTAQQCTLYGHHQYISSLFVRFHIHFQFHRSYSNSVTEIIYQSKAKRTKKNKFKSLSLEMNKLIYTRHREKGINIYEFFFRMRTANMCSVSTSTQLLYCIQLTYNKRKYTIIKEHSCVRDSRISNKFFFLFHSVSLR